MQLLKTWLFAASAGKGRRTLALVQVAVTIFVDLTVGVAQS